MIMSFCRSEQENQSFFRGRNTQQHTLDTKRAVGKPHGQISRVKIATSESFGCFCCIFVVAFHGNVAPHDYLADLFAIRSNILQFAFLDGRLLAFRYGPYDANIVGSDESRILPSFLDVILRIVLVVEVSARHWTKCLGQAVDVND